MVTFVFIYFTREKSGRCRHDTNKSNGTIETEIKQNKTSTNAYKNQRESVTVIDARYICSLAGVLTVLLLFDPKGSNIILLEFRLLAILVGVLEKVG